MVNMGVAMMVMMMVMFVGVASVLGLGLGPASFSSSSLPLGSFRKLNPIAVSPQEFAVALTLSSERTELRPVRGRLLPDGGADADIQVGHQGERDHVAHEGVQAQVVDLKDIKNVHNLDGVSNLQFFCYIDLLPPIMYVMFTYGVFSIRFSIQTAKMHKI